MSQKLKRVDHVPQILQTETTEKDYANINIYTRKLSTMLAPKIDAKVAQITVATADEKIKLSMCKLNS